MKVIRKFQFNSRFERLYDQCMEELKVALSNAKTLKEKNEIITWYGFAIDDFNHYACKKTDETMVVCGLDAHLQKSADFLEKSPKHIYNHSR